MAPQRADYSECSVRTYRNDAGVCDRCGTTLTGRRKRWCGEACYLADLREHFWTAARNVALKRDGSRCVSCGSTKRLEVNHIEPRVGRGYLTGCWNHIAGLETLCKPCHQEVTNHQVRERKS